MAWLGRFSAGYRQIFNAIFAPEWMHYLMHALLYAGVAFLLLFSFNIKITRQSVGLILTAVLLIGALQESLQLFSGVQILRWNSLLDLGVDLLGGVMGILLLKLVRRFKIRSDSMYCRGTS